MSQHLVLVDDTDPNIQYSGPWFTAQNTQLNTGNFGAPFQNTLHGVNVDASLSYSFSGSSITVIGTSITTNASGTQDPTWECFIDNNSIGWKTVLQYAENNWVFCQNTQLQDGHHVLTVKAKVSNQHTFWFDEIQYLPSPNAQLDQSMLLIESSDPAIQYSSGWTELSGIVNLTQTAGSTISYEFSGVSLSFVALLPPNFPAATSTSTYSIDGQTPVSFLVPNGIPELYNQVLFQTGQLSAGQHKLVVTYHGNSGTAPLAFDRLVVRVVGQGTTTPSTPTTSISPSSSTSGTSGTVSTINTTTGAKGTQTATNTASSAVPLSSDIPTGVAGSIVSSSVPSSGSAGSSNSTSHLGSTSSSTNAKQNLGAIIGGALGGVILLLLLLILFLFIRRRSNRGARRLSEKSPLGDVHDIVDPFTVPPTSALQSENYTPEGQYLTSQSIANKLAQERKPADAPITSNNMRSTSPLTDVSSSVLGGGIPVPALTPLRNPSLSPATTSPSSSSLADGAMNKAQEAETVQRSASSQGDDARFLRHEDSGVRIPPTRDSVVELPPMYTPG